MRTVLVAVLASSLLACAGTAPAPSTSSTTGGGLTEAPAEVSAPPIDVAALGDPCAEDGTCAAGVTCVRYYGFAGAAGPEFRSCEVRCDDGGGCPDGASCTTIADGPGRVCRAPVGE
ncbi:MAG: hypothetical protein R2939_01310 [Kofleriaceae bacterium]